MNKIKTLMEKHLLQGNGKVIIRQMKTLDLSSNKEKSQRSLIIERLQGNKDYYLKSKNPLVNDILEVYQEYWHCVLMKKKSPTLAENKLAKDISYTLKAYGIDTKRKRKLSELEAILSKTLKKHGFECVVGIVFPYREFMIWKKQETKVEKVFLIKKTVKVKVVMLKNLVCKGWYSWASDEAMSVAGWANKDKIYCLVDRYDRRTEDYKVSYISHEAQHFLDYKEHPKLDTKNLEFRAKLIELIKSRKSTNALLKKFYLQRNSNSVIPHAYASYIIFHRLNNLLFESNELRSLKSFQSVPKGRLRKACLNLYYEHTEEIKQVPKGFD